MQLVMVDEEQGAPIVESRDRDWISNAVLQGSFCGSPKTDIFLALEQQI